MPCVMLLRKIARDREQGSISHSKDIVLNMLRGIKGICSIVTTRVFPQQELVCDSSQAALAFQNMFFFYFFFFTAQGQDV